MISNVIDHAFIQIKSSHAIEFSGAKRRKKKGEERRE
jgi:hypothetical protein